MVSWTEPVPTGRLVLADGTVIKARGCGAHGVASGEVCFNTAMTGYQEILTDPSYAGQIITFTFPHIGNVGTNRDDMEALHENTACARGCIMRAPITLASNYRATQEFDAWLKARGIIALSGVDTRALTNLIRRGGMPNGVIAHHPDGRFDLAALRQKAATWPGLEGMELASEVTTPQPVPWTQAVWDWSLAQNGAYASITKPKYHVVAIDYGVKRNILRLLSQASCKVTVVPAHTPAEEILRLAPDGIFLSNGPGDPAATAVAAVPILKRLIAQNIPIFGICLGHQLLAIALGGRTRKMRQGHHGANHPVRDDITGKVEITSMNHGFAVDSASLPKTLYQTHRSLFDGSNCGLAMEDKAIFSVQHHPEASPGPTDSTYLFARFVAQMQAHRDHPPCP